MSLLIKVKPGIPNKLDDGDNPTYEDWIGRVDDILHRTRGCSLFDLPDCPTRDWYDKRVRPIRAANKALKWAGAEVW